MSDSQTNKQPVRRRTSKRVEPLDIDELLSRPSMHRFDSLLKDDQALPPVTSTFGAHNVGAVTSTATEYTASTDTTVSVQALDVNALDLSVPSLIVRPQREYRIREGKRASDGHSKSEQAVYEALWRLGASRGRVDPLDRVRVIGIGDRALSKQADISYSTCRAATAALQEKLALEVRPPRAAGGPKVFIVFNEQEILRRRKAAGLTHVERRTSGVFLYNPATNIRAPKLDALLSEAVTDRARTSGPPEERSVNNDAALRERGVV